MTANSPSSSSLVAAVSSKSIRVAQALSSAVATSSRAHSNNNKANAAPRSLAGVHLVLALDDVLDPGDEWHGALAGVHTVCMEAFNWRMFAPQLGSVEVVQLSEEPDRDDVVAALRIAGHVHLFFHERDICPGAGSFFIRNASIYSVTPEDEALWRAVEWDGMTATRLTVTVQLGRYPDPVEDKVADVDEVADALDLFKQILGGHSITVDVVLVPGQLPKTQTLEARDAAAVRHGMTFEWAPDDPWWLRPPHK